ncbi:MAG TPA: cupin domain-containing protein [Firmicutes bacterium]|jgi:quercetin dioxygenase-like cupin family protein|nr:cupin domain-containing protein [Bacillota bacterium]
MHIVNRNTGEAVNAEAVWKAVRLTCFEGLSVISMILPAGESVEPHMVEDRFYLYVVRGCVLFHSEEGSCELKVGDLAVDEPGSVHGIINQGKEEALLLLLRQAPLEE